MRETCVIPVANVFSVVSLDGKDSSELRMVSVLLPVAAMLTCLRVSTAFTQVQSSSGDTVVQ